MITGKKDRNRKINKQESEKDRNRKINKQENKKASKKEKKKSRARLKKEQQERQQALESGVWFVQIGRSAKEKDYATKYIVNGLLNFFVVFGTIGSVLGAFGIKWDAVALAPALLICSILFSLFYYHQNIRLAGYALVVAGFVLGLQQFAIYLRSGFAVIANAVMKVIELRLELPIEREYQVYVENTSLAVNLCIFFIIMVVMLFFNIVISEFKNYWIVLFFTFPFVQLPIYLNESVPLVYFVMYAVGVIVLYCLRSGGHYGINGGKEKNYHSRKWKKTQYHFYYTHGLSNIGVTLLVLAMCVVVVLAASVIVPKDKFLQNTTTSEWKAQTKQFAKKISLVGFFGMFYNNSEGAGGVGTGRLGDVRYVTMDYEPDLYIYTQESELENKMYIRAYTAKDYKGDRWEIEGEPLDSAEEEESAVMGMLTEKVESNEVDWNNPLTTYTSMSDYFVNIDRQTYNYLGTEMKAVRVQNVGANERFTYQPYWDARIYARTEGIQWTEATKDWEWQMLIPLKEKLPVGYYQDNYYTWDTSSKYTATEIGQLAQSVKEQNISTGNGWSIWKSFFSWEEKYRDYVYNNYLDVDKKQKEKLQKLCEENGMTGGLQMVEQLQQFFYENYEYSLMPGRTPEGEDFVDYFLFEQDKGYCVYFASAATLMFRSMGIPARYTTGYAIEAEDFTSGEKMTAYEVGNFGDVPSMEEVNKIEVTDAKAHAWVEIYIDNFGWWPVEVTVSDGSYEMTQDEQNQALAGLVATVFGREAVAQVRKTTIMILIRALIAVIVFVIVFSVVNISVRMRRRWLWNHRMEKSTMEKQFAYMQRMASVCNAKWNACDSYRTIGEIYVKRFGISASLMESVVCVYEKMKYSSHPLEHAEYEQYRSNILQATNQMYAGQKWYRKLIIRLVKML